eukprot:CAMPEP_0117770962 /NCGR_PEP_ID=MMETSP0947-20121206/24159_1 /TAXON_ID=44440 /ORGANISM="Chattonella subsalsa, Strain CCMP2191" /LENGTH=87 /DNA_ID=CAMNT_0005596187 /DNA_START=30 /DNA_END=289 /DNA_ORIENTATION=+
MKKANQDHPFIEVFGEDEIDKIDQLHKTICTEMKKNRLSANADVKELAGGLKKLLQQIDELFKHSKLPKAPTIRQTLKELLDTWDPL